MELTDRHVEAIRDAARKVDYGSITIQIGAESKHLDIDVHNRLRLEKEATEEPNPADRKDGKGFRT